MLLPHVCRYNIIANPQKFADIAEFLGENIDGLSISESAEQAIKALFALSTDVGIPTSLKAAGIKEKDIPLMSDNAMLDGNAFSNPRKGNAKEIAEIFKAAF